MEKLLKMIISAGIAFLLGMTFTAFSIWLTTCCFAHGQQVQIIWTN